MIKNKKGEEEEGLTGNTLGVVLGLTATIIIVIFIYIAITQVIRDTELESAQAIADRAKASIDAIPAGQSANVTFQGSNDLKAGWYVVGWGKQNVDKPDKCFFGGCLCVCKGTTRNDCQTRGVCRDLPFDDIQIMSFYQKSNPARTGEAAEVRTTGGIPKPTNGDKTVPEFIKEDDPYIKIPSNLFLLEIKKSENTLEISESSRWIEYLKSQKSQ